MRKGSKSKGTGRLTMLNAMRSSSWQARESGNGNGSGRGNTYIYIYKDGSITIMTVIMTTMIMIIIIIMMILMMFGMKGGRQSVVPQQRVVVLHE